MFRRPITAALASARRHRSSGPCPTWTINKILTRLGQILDTAVRYELIDRNPVKTGVEKLKEAESKRVRLHVRRPAHLGADEPALVRS